MSSSVFEIGAVVDVATLNAGFDESVEAAQAYAEQMSVAFDEMGGRSARAFSGMTNDVKQSAATVAPAYIQLGQLTKQAAASSADYRRALILSKDSMVDSAVSARLLGAAFEKMTADQAAVTAMTKQLAAANLELGAASHSVVTGQQATSAAIRTLEGNTGLRAIENFVAKTLGLGPAMQALFPVIGALAFGQILFEMADKVIKVREAALGAAKAFDEAFDESHEKASVTNDDLRITSDRLQLVIDKLSGTPGNGALLALDAARKMADQLAVALRGDRKELEALLKEHDVTMFGESISGVAATGQQHKEMLKDQQDLSNQVNAANRDFQKATANTSDTAVIKTAGDARDNAIRAAYQKQITAYQEESNRLKKEQADADILVTGGVRGAQSIDNSAKIAAINGRAQQLVDALANENLQVKIASQTAQKDQLEQDKKLAAERKREAAQASSAANKAAEARLKGDEAELAQDKLNHTMSLKDIEEFWAAKITSFTKGSAQYNTVLEKMAQLSDENLRKNHESLVKFKKEQEKLDEEGAKAFRKADDAITEARVRTDEDNAKSGSRWDGYWRSVAKGDEITASLNASFAEFSIKAKESAGGISVLAAAQQMAAVHAAVHTARIKALREELEKLQAEGAKLHPGEKGYSENKEKQQGVQNQITQESGSGQLQAVQDKTAVQNAVAKPYLDAFSAINNGWLKVQNDLIAGNGRLGQNFAKMGLALVESGAQAAEKWLAKKAETYIRDQILHHSAAAAKTATEVASQTAQTAAMAAAQATQTSTAAAAAAARATATSAINVGEVISFAAVAGAGETAATLDPAAGALMFAATLGAFAAPAAFEQGTMFVPREGAAILHPGEAVLGSPAASVMREMMGGGGGRSGDVNINMGSSRFEGGNADFRSQLRQHRSELAKQIKSLHREGHLKGVTSPGRA